MGPTVGDFLGINRRADQGALWLLSESRGVAPAVGGLTSGQSGGRGWCDVEFVELLGGLSQ